MAKTAKEKSGLEFLETPEGLAGELGKAQSIFEKNKNLAIGIGGGLLVLVLGFLGYNYYKSTQNEEGQVAMFPAVNQFEADSLAKSLKGDGANEGLLGIADNYGSGQAGNLANFYSGVALLRQGKYDEAIERLGNFSSGDLLVQARAYSLIGDAYMEKNNAEEAISNYKKAVDYKPNKFFTPGYLIKLGLAYEKAKQYKEAVETYAKVVDEYPQSAEVITAKKYKAQIEELAGE
ncbi:MAG: tetratricopeptide repeat protein [Spirosomataceae bacterium]